MKISVFSPLLLVVGSAFFLSAADAEANCRRVLASLPTSEDEKIADMTTKCGNFEYSVDLVVANEHLYFWIAPSSSTSPQDELANEACKSELMMTADTSAAGTFVKRMNVLDGAVAALYEDEVFANGVEKIPFGQYSLDEIVTAYYDASVDAPGHEGEEYHYAENNCGDLLASFLDHLGYVTTPEQTQAVASQLLATAPGYLSKLRDTVAGTDKEGWTDEELLTWVVELRTAKMYAQEEN
jgi:hypothetical protein